MAKSYPEQNYDLADGMIEDLEPYRADGVVSLVKGSCGAVPGPGDFRKAGEKAGSAAVEAGKKYMDRTGEMIEIVAAKTGLAFPTVMQRYFEIWVHCTGLAGKWQLKKATMGGIIYEVLQCSLSERASREWPGIGATACSGYCLGALEGIARELGMILTVGREDMEAGQGLCRFSIIPKL
jgi:hypothetical protein